MRARAHLVFDGACGFCTRCVDWLARIDPDQRIEVHPWQGEGVLERFGLTRAQAEASVWLISGERVRSGIHAVAAAIDIARGTRLLGSVVALPVVEPVAQYGYHWVARHRGRFPGVIAWCRDPSRVKPCLPPPQGCGPTGGST